MAFLLVLSRHLRDLKSLPVYGSFVIEPYMVLLAEYKLMWRFLVRGATKIVQ